jgi:hypothetical protein
MQIDGQKRQAAPANLNILFFRIDDFSNASSAKRPLI